VVADKYRIEQVIGAGGMGVVLAARHIHLNQRVAIKFLRGKPHPELVGRFMREARAAASLNSEYVVRVSDVDTLPSGEPFMVMEYLTGKNLSKVIRGYAAMPMPIFEVADYITQTCRGIGEAHQLGIVHRDLKPGNLFETTRPDGSRLVKVLDFGISKIIDDPGAGDEQTLTATNMILGSPQYASPEQLRSVKSVDTRTDIWAIGVILYYMLTGRRPFEAENLSALCLAIATDQPTPIAQIRPDIPSDLEQLVAQCLVKKREQRIQNTGEIIHVLRPYLRGSASERAFGPFSAQHAPAGDAPESAAVAVGPAAGPATTDGAPPATNALALHSSFDGPSFAAPRGHVMGTAVMAGEVQASTHLSSTGKPLVFQGSVRNGTIAVGEVATGGTRSAWTAPPQTGRQKTLAVGAALVLGILIAVVGVQYKRSSEPLADETQIESVESTAPAAPIEAATPRAVSTGIQVGTAKEVPTAKPAQERRGPRDAIEGKVGEHAIATRPTTMLTKPGEGSFAATLPPQQRVIIQAISGEYVQIAWLRGQALGWVRRSDLRKIPEL
jgi:eukaryotic-like serine/threonine-protein kinase